MTYHEALELGRRMTPEEVNATMRSLSADPRWAAVLVWLDTNREAFAAAVSSQSLSQAHGKLAHAAGSLHAVTILQAQAAQVMRAMPVTGGMTPPEEED